MSTWIFSLLSVIAVSLISLIGLVTTSKDEARTRRRATFLVSFAVGTLLGDAFIHLIPQVFADKGKADLQPSLWVLGGMMLFFMVEKLLRHRHGPLHAYFHPGTVARPELAAINLFGDGVHNFIDGALIAASYMASPALGLATTVAVVFHEIPQELGDFGVLLHSGLSVRKAAWLNLLSASAAIVGTLVTLLAGRVAGPCLSRALLPVTAGGFIYIAAADLIPELQHDHSRRALLTQFPCIVLGIAVMAGLALME